MNLRALRVLMAAEAEAPVLRLDEPLSLWGGFDPRTGEVTDRRHPQSGIMAGGLIWCMEFGRGSSSASSILLEAVRVGTAPAAILLREEDGILALGAAVAKEIYGRCPAVLTLSADDHATVGGSISARIGMDGGIAAETERGS